MVPSTSNYIDSGTCSDVISSVRHCATMLSIAYLQVPTAKLFLASVQTNTWVAWWLTQKSVGIAMDRVDRGFKSQPGTTALGKLLTPVPLSASNMG